LYLYTENMHTRKHANRQTEKENVGRTHENSGNSLEQLAHGGDEITKYKINTNTRTKQTPNNIKKFQVSDETLDTRWEKIGTCVTRTSGTKNFN